MPVGAEPLAVRVLVVDDEEAVRDAMRSLLSAPGVEVVAVAGFAAARETLERRRFDLVITDLRLRGRADTEGFDLLAWVRAHLPGVPVLLITGLGWAGFHREAARRGAAGCWRKGMPIDDLLARVRALGIPVRD